MNEVTKALQEKIMEVLVPAPMKPNWTRCRIIISYALKNHYNDKQFWLYCQQNIYNRDVNALDELSRLGASVIRPTHLFFSHLFGPSLIKELRGTGIYFTDDMQAKFEKIAHKKQLNILTYLDEYGIKQVLDVRRKNLHMTDEQFKLEMRPFEEKKVLNENVEIMHGPDKIVQNKI